MTTTARPVPGPEVTAPSDAMDLHSDNGYDLDIDFDLESNTELQRHDDDDLSLQDAEPDAGLDLHTAATDHDDFMVDKDDLIEDDEIDYDDVDIVDAGQPSLTTPSITREQIFDEDLIDYSDDEEQQPQIAQEDPSRVGEAPQDHNTQSENPNVQESLDHGQSETLNPTAYEDHAQEYQEEEIDYDGQGDNLIVDQSWNEAQDADWDAVVANSKNEQDAYADGDDCEDAEQQQADQLHGEINLVEQSVETANDDQLEKEKQVEQKPQDQNNTEVEQDNKVHKELHSHPITVIYGHDELWLFKPIDSENDDDWLLEDESVARNTFFALFQACRVALGSEINSDIELGLRFDDFYAMEIFEDSTASAYARLQELIDMYLELHAQDGTTSPDSFRITLQFRPRVSTLLSALKKATENKVGYSGLNMAVAAGETAFNNACSIEHIDETNELWDDEQEQEQEQEPEQEQEQENYDEDANEFQQKEQHSEKQDFVSHIDHVNTAPASEEEAASNNDTHEAKDVPETTAAHSNSQHTPATGYSGHDDGDIIDYSDDEEYSTNVVHTGQASVNAPSSGSSTVQGDDSSYAKVNIENVANPADPIDDGRASEYDYNEDLGGASNEQDPVDLGLAADLGHYEEHAGLDYSDYDNEVFDQEDYSQDYAQDESTQPLEAGEYTAQGVNEGDEDYYYDGLEDTTTNQQDDFNLAEGAEDNDNVSIPGQAANAEEHPGVDRFLDLNSTSEAVVTGGDGSTLPEDVINDVTEEYYINYDDEEEDGAVQQPPVASSTAARPVTALSSGLNLQGSPLGQKRSIDEVGNGLDGATESLDAKRPRV